MATPSRKRSTNHALTSCVQPISARITAEMAAQLSAVLPAPNRRAIAGISGDETMKPIGVIAADRPIRLGETPWRCRMKESSG